MRLFWTFSSMPELEHLTPDGRRQVLRAAGVGHSWLWMLARGVFVGLIAYGLAVNTVLRPVQPPDVRMIAAAIIAILIAAAAMQMQLQMMRIAMRAQIMNLLRGECVPVCLKCGYDQAGNTTERCPECGASIRVPND